MPKDFSLQEEYERFISINNLFIISNSGVKTDRDALFIDKDEDELRKRMQVLLNNDYGDDFIKKYRVINSGSYKLLEVIKNKEFIDKYITKIEYRPFDYQYIYYDPTIISRS